MEAPVAGAEEKKRQQNKRRVQFAGADADDDDDDAPKKRQPLLPEKDKKKQKKKGLLEGIADAGAGEEGDATLAGERGRRGAFGSAEDARAAAASRAELRSQKKGFGKLDTGFGSVASVASAEEEFQGEEEEKDAIEPFNLDKERQEGFYDAEGNYVEYRRDAELHDAWLDSATVEPKYAAKAAALAAAFAKSENEAEGELSRKELAAIKRRIANALQPGESVLQGLRRLGGTAQGGKKSGSRGGRGGRGRGTGPPALQKLSDGGGDEEGGAANKQLFDQLTDDSFKLMDVGETDVYSEKRETFLREAEGYEAMERARLSQASSSQAGEAGAAAKRKREEGSATLDMFGDGDEDEAGGAEKGVPENGAVPAPGLRAASKGKAPAEVSVGMFGDDEGAAGEGEPDQGNRAAASGGTEGASVSQGPRSAASEAVGGGGGVGEGSSGSAPSDGYVYDESSGYYYNAAQGYYYDSSTGLFCSAATGKWYRFDEAKNEYVEVTETTDKPASD